MPIERQINTINNIMPLPTLDTPKFELRLPSTGKMIEYRPFLVKEEKILLIAQESGNNRDMISAMKDIVKACTFDKVNPNDLTSYDLEFIFLKLRARSVGETSNVKIKCEKCEAYNEVAINLDEVDLSEIPEKPVTIMLNDKVGITMRHIRVRDLASIADEKKDSSEKIIDTVIASIENIFDENGVYPTDESKKDELTAFVNSLNRKVHMKAIEDFIATTPKVSCIAEFKCKHCEAENKIALAGLQSFFG